MPPAVENRSENGPSRARHAGKCAVCNSGRREEVEAAYLRPETLAKIATDFGVSQFSVLRHAQFFGLGPRRAEKAEPPPRDVVARIPREVKRLDRRLLIAAVRELNRMQGRRGRRHSATPKDLRRDRDDRRWAESQIERIMLDRRISREEAVALAREHAPTFYRLLT